MATVEQQLIDIATAHVEDRQYIAMLAAAFHRATDIPPEECAVVHQEVDEGTAYYFARIVGWDEDGTPQLETAQRRGWLRRNARRLLEQLI